MNVENLVMMVFLMRDPKKSPKKLRFTSRKDNTPHIMKQLEEFANPK
jgi:hypothetical protein